MNNLLMDVKLHVFYGPNLHVPFAAVMAEFDSPYDNKLAISAIELQWGMFNRKPLWSNIPPYASLSFPELVRALAVKLQHPDDPESATIKIFSGVGKQRSSVFLKYIDPSASALVLGTALFYAESIFRGTDEDFEGLKKLAPRLRHVQSVLAGLLPQAPIISTLVNEAYRRSIPVFTVAENSRILMFGQGAEGTHYFSAANERDSFTGMNLQRDKTLSNLLVKRLGFPGVTHAVASQLEQAKEIAHKLGYPVVVKPVSSGKGNGVSAFVIDDVDLGNAFRIAAEFSSQGVIIEGFVQGIDHRLAVFGGKLAWVVARYPACVTGDGESSIAELIQEQNKWRQDSPSAIAAGLLQLQPDADMLQHLKKQGYTLHSRLPKGICVNLRSVANVSKGGSLAEVTSFAHPDNVAMAEAIARGFRMENLGVDFMTSDISRSWRELTCAVIEVNGTPGILFDSSVEKILLARFPENTEGRIPCVLLIDPPAGMIAGVSSLLGVNGLTVGQTSSDSTLLGQYARCKQGENLLARVTSLISDPGCEALVVEIDHESICIFGLPVDKFDLAVSFENIPPEVNSLVLSCSKNLIDANDPETEIEPLIVDILKNYKK